jgi:glycosyltransferase involved in cell wall biosynthesis
MVSKALVVGAYQRKAEEIAKLGVDLTVLIPPVWRDARGSQEAVHRHTAGYELKVIPIRFNGNFHLHYYPTLANEMARIRPHALHMDEEPYNAATWHGLRVAQKMGATATFFTWQNLHRSYPPPFSWMERYNYAHAPIAIAGSQDAADVLADKGYPGETVVIPQFGVDPAIYAPPVAPTARAAFHIGYAGGLLPEKGVDLLLNACARLRGEWRLRVVGEGKERAALVAQAETLGIAPRTAFLGRRDSSQMPAFYHDLDVLVLPSRTTPSWKEQFGRVLIEAMACGVPTIGSDSGEIPRVIGDAGLIFPENDAPELATHLQALMDRPALGATLSAAGRQRILERFTMASVAARTVDVYEKLCTLASTPNS